MGKVPCHCMTFLIHGVVSGYVCLVAFFFVGFSVLQMRPCMTAEEGFKAPKRLFLYVFLKYLPLFSFSLNLTG